MRKVCVFIIIFVLMNLMGLLWKATPIPQEDLTRLYNNIWAIRLAISVLCGIASVIIVKEDD